MSTSMFCHAIIATTIFHILVGLPTAAQSRLEKKSQSTDIPFNYRQTSTNIFNCDGVRSRRDIRDLSAAEVQDWQTVFIELINERETVANSFWDNLVRVHVAFTSEAHRGAYFLSWHRLFLLVLENNIRGRGRPNFALPYWDWSADADDAALSEIWKRSLIGGARSGLKGAPRPIPNGPFSRISARFPRPHKVRRNFTSGVSNGMRQLVGAPLLRLIINASTFQIFATNTEIAHDIVHVAIGGDMNVINNAPNDPVFFLHHAFVDYIYRRHQELYGVNNFGGVHNFSGVVLNADPDYVLQAFGRHAKFGFSTPCVNYIPYSKGLSSVREAKSVDKDTPDLSVLENACRDDRIRMGVPKQDCMKAVEQLRNSTA